MDDDDDDVDEFGSDMDEGDAPMDAAPWDEEAVGETAAALFSKHRHSTSPESRQVCAVLDAVLVAIEEQQLQPTATAVFAAVLSSMQQKSLRQQTPEVRRTAIAHAQRSRDALRVSRRLCIAGNRGAVHGAGHGSGAGPSRRAAVATRQGSSAARRYH